MDGCKKMKRLENVFQIRLSYVQVIAQFPTLEMYSSIHIHIYRPFWSYASGYIGHITGYMAG